MILKINVRTIQTAQHYIIIKLSARLLLESYFGYIYFLPIEYLVMTVLPHQVSEEVISKNK